MTDNPNLGDGLLVRAGADPAVARRVAVLVHGRDQDEGLMLDVARRLALPDVAYLLPVAARGSWYGGRYFDPVERLEPELGWALEAIERALARAAGEGARAPERIVLGGFSQGACLAAELVARRARPLGGLAVLTGSLIGAPGARAVPAGLAGMPVYASCAAADAWIGLDDARATAEALAGGGAKVTFEVLDDTEHHVCDRAVAGLRGLLTG